MITREDGKKLLKLAKDAVSSFFAREDVAVDSYIQNKFRENQGVFVTLQKDGELRGCIGFPEPVFPLYEAIIKAARAAAFEDPRFMPLSKHELKDIKFEVSVLTVPELVKVNKPEDYLKKIKIGEDGLIIRGMYHSGLLLPQVFTEYNCDAKTALEMTCQKAGLNAEAWKELKNRIYKFQAEIFSE